tara:strand:+ start:3656 stop:4576 length:921 start_codon:yes stop_codon:yes gene_type:complete
MPDEQDEDATRATDLSSLSVHEVSLVKRGANKRKFALWKSEDFEMRDLTAAILSSPGHDDNTEIIKQMTVDGISKEGQSTIEDAMKLLSAVKEELNAGLLDKIQNALGLKAKQEEQDEFDRGEESEGARLADENKAESEFDRGEESEGTELSDEDKLKKSDDPRIEALFKANEELQAKIEKHESEKREKEFIQKAAEHYNVIPGATPQEVGILLRDVADLSADLCTRVETIFKATNSFSQNSGIFGEQGTSQNSGGTDATNQNDFEVKIEKLANQRVAKTGEPYLKAYEKTLKENQDLYSKSIGWS